MTHAQSITQIAPDADSAARTGPILCASRLYKTYRLGRVNVPVLKGVDLTIERGERVAILGASGSGKSTLLHLLGGLDTPDRDGGSILYHGESLQNMAKSAVDRYRNRDVGFVFQLYHLLPELTVLQNVILPAIIGVGRIQAAKQRTEVESRAKLLLQSFGLAHRLKHRPVELSGGERQRAAIARALINNPALLLADEPTGNLDAETGGVILDAMMNLTDRDEHRQTMVIVTHDQNTAARADRIVRMKDGVIEDA
ncbi:MAG: ABC transporter ATP-binding protein [Planctomycetota bacterium]